MEGENNRFSKEKCISLLTAQAEKIKVSGEDRFPKRSDFTEEEVNAIKAMLGPWPRALEAAGLKEPRSDEKLEINRQKRIRAKRRRTAALIQKKKEKSK